MSKLRSVNTKFWSDNYIIELKPIDKLLFLYLLTNDKTNMLGIYELHIRKISFDTGIEEEPILKGFEAFAKGNKASYIDGYVCMHNFTRHQSYNKNMKKSALTSYEELPLEVRKQPFCKPILKGLEPFPEGFEPTAEYECEIEREYEKERESAPAREEPLFDLGDDFEQLKKLEKPLTVEQRKKLVSRFGEPMVEDVLISMENHQGLTDKYKSVYLTALNWCKKRQGDQPENSNQGPKVRPDTVIVN